VLQDRDDLLDRRVRAVEDGSLALGEPLLAGAALQQADVLVLAEVIGHTEIAGALAAVRDAPLVLAAEEAQVVLAVLAAVADAVAASTILDRPHGELRLSRAYAHARKDFTPPPDALNLAGARPASVCVRIANFMLGDPGFR
jgi:hypothetical protein